MTKQTAILDLLDTTRGGETPGANVERSAIPVLLVIGTTEDIRAGTVLINSAVRLPQSVHFATKQYGPWKLLLQWTGSRLSGRCQNWVAFLLHDAKDQCRGRFFFATRSVDGSSQEVARGGGIAKLQCIGESWKSQANASSGCTTQGPPPTRGMPNPARSFATFRYHVSRNVWDFKLVFGRRAQIGRTSKGI